MNKPYQPDPDDDTYYHEDFICTGCYCDPCECLDDDEETEWCETG